MRSLSEIVQANKDAEEKELRRRIEDGNKFHQILERGMLEDEHDIRKGKMPDSLAKRIDNQAIVAAINRIGEGGRKQAGIDRAHEQGGPKAEYMINRCEACGEHILDCFCNGTTEEELI